MPVFHNDLLEQFGELVIEARNSGLQTYVDILNEKWSPKNPNQQQKIVMQFITSLSKEQKSNLAEAIKYFTDLSFFKMMSTLDEGFKEVSFNVTAVTTSTNVVLNDQKDGGSLHLNYWNWLSKYGQ